MLIRDKEGHLIGEKVESQRGRSRCDLCGGPPDACWFGAVRDTTICAGCAIEHLPRLIGDALVAKAVPGIEPRPAWLGDWLPHDEWFDHHLLLFKAAFWRGALACVRALALTQARRGTTR
jgi:hypothetical protein